MRMNGFKSVVLIKCVLPAVLSVHQNLLYMTRLSHIPAHSLSSPTKRTAHSLSPRPPKKEKSDAQKGQLTQRWAHSSRAATAAASSSVVHGTSVTLFVLFLGRTIVPQSCAIPRGCTAFPSSWAAVSNAASDVQSNAAHSDREKRCIRLVSAGLPQFYLLGLLSNCYGSSGASVLKPFRL